MKNVKKAYIMNVNEFTALCVKLNYYAQQFSPIGFSSVALFPLSFMEYFTRYKEIDIHTNGHEQLELNNIIIIIK